MGRIRTTLGKKPHNSVTWLELSDYLDLPPDLVRDLLLD